LRPLRKILTSSSSSYSEPEAEARKRKRIKKRKVFQMKGPKVSWQV